MSMNDDQYSLWLWFAILAGSLLTIEMIWSRPHSGMEQKEESHMPEFIRILRKESWLFVFSRCALALVVGLLSWPLTIWLIDLYDLYSPIFGKRFHAVGYPCQYFIHACLFLTGYNVMDSQTKPGGTLQGSRKANPQLHDLLNCAVELDEKSKSKNLSFMEKRVLETTEREANSIAWGKGTRPNYLYWVSVLLGLGVGAGLAVWGSGRSPVTKAFDSLSDEPGITISTSLTGTLNQADGPPSNEFTRGSDVSIFADIIRGHRGQKEASIEYRDGDKIESIDMLETPVLGRFEFVVPALKDVFEYRVVTPSLVTDWHMVNPYDPPALRSAKWKILPPSYLKMEEFEHDGFGYVRAPEGSEISLSLEIEPLPERVELAKLLSIDGNLSLEGNLSTYSYQFILEEEWKGHLELSDLDKPERPPVAYDDLVFAPIPDEPPLVEITEPAKDLQLPSDATFLVEVFASDDHGVSDVRMRIEHAGDSEEETIFVEPVEKEKRLTYVFDLNERPLAVGDVLTYMALASDK